MGQSRIGGEVMSYYYYVWMKSNQVSSGVSRSKENYFDFNVVINHCGNEITILNYKKISEKEYDPLCLTCEKEGEGCGK